MESLIKILILVAVAKAYSPEEELLYGSFPNDFVWGAATAAYQVLRPHEQGFPIHANVCTDRGWLG